MKEDMKNIQKDCEKYIAMKISINNKSVFDKQYLDMAQDILVLLKNLEKERVEKVSEAFYMNLIDSFDIDSNFWKKFRVFQDKNPDLFE